MWKGICGGRGGLVLGGRAQSHISTKHNADVQQRPRGESIIEGLDGGHTGPPMAPRRTASACLAASRALSVSGEPEASIEA